MRIHRGRRKLTWDDLNRGTVEQRIALLVERLDDSTSGLSYFVGETVPGTDSPAYLLAQMGEAGMDALIGALDDTRLTRGHQGAGISPPTFLTVSDLVAQYVQSGIGVSGFSHDPQQRKAEMKRVWEMVRHLPREERWLAILEDDQMSPAAWFYAAQALASPAWVEPSGIGSRSSSGGLPEHFEGASIKWTALYKAKRERVYRALDKRARQLIATDFHRSNDMVVACAVWDLERTVPLLLQAKSRLLTLARERAEGPALGDLVALAELVSPLVLAKVEGAWDGYEEMLDSIRNPRLTSGLDEAMGPLWQHPDDERAREIAERIFVGTGMWNSARHKQGEIGGSTTMLMLLPSYQRGLLNGLKDHSALTVGTRSGERVVSYRLADRPNAYYNATIDGARASVPVGGEIPLRACDVLMERLKRPLGMEGFDIGSSVAERDEWIARAIALMSAEKFVWPTVSEGSLGMEPVFVSRPVWPEPYRGVRPGTFVRRGGGS
jgi:hypothetical protein